MRRVGVGAAVGGGVLSVCLLVSGAAGQAAGAPRSVDKAKLAFSARTAAVGTWVEYTVTGTPAAAAQGQRVRVLVRAREGWEPIGTMQFDRTGTAHGRVTGKEPGVGRYVARVLTSSGRTAVQSNTVTVAWTAG